MPPVFVLNVLCVHCFRLHQSQFVAVVVVVDRTNVRFIYVYGNLLRFYLLYSRYDCNVRVRLLLLYSGFDCNNEIKYNLVNMWLFHIVSHFKDVYRCVLC